MPTKKRPKNAAHQKGDILLFQRDYAGSKETQLIFFLDAWYVKTNHYQILTLSSGYKAKDLTRMEVHELSEFRFDQWYRTEGGSWWKWKPIPLDDLGFLVVYGNPRELVKKALKSERFARKIETYIKRGQKIIDRWQNIETRFAEHSKRLEAEDGEAGNP